MKNLHLLDQFQDSLSLILGFSASVVLLLMISVLSAPQKDDEIVPALVIDLSTWQTADKTADVNKQVKKPQKKAPQNKKTPELKKPPKAKTIKNELASKPQQAIAAKPIVETETPNINADLPPGDDDILPTPVPTFKLTETPRFLHKATPVYPPQMKTSGQTGLVKLSALIDKHGRVRKVTIIKSAGDEFDQAAIAAIKASTFIPAKIGGQPVAVLLKLPVNFRLL